MATTAALETREFESSGPVQLTMTIPSEWRTDGDGFLVDARLGESARERDCPGSQPCVPILQGVGWLIADGYSNRLWIVDHDGEAIAILTEASENSFENWAARVEEVLATLEWNPGG